MITVVCDTNILISALFFPNSNPDKIIQLARRGTLKLYLSKDILEEFRVVLQKKFALNEKEALRYVRFFRKISHRVSPQTRLNLIKAVDADNRILECAAAAEVDYLITGDQKHILPLEQIGKTRIISAAEFLNIIKDYPALKVL